MFSVQTKPSFREVNFSKDINHKKILIQGYYGKSNFKFSDGYHRYHRYVFRSCPAFMRLISCKLEINLHMSKKSCTFARQMRADGKPTNAAISINHKMTDQMASIQDIQALEERIYDAVQEYLDNPDGYENAVLRVYLDEDDMIHRAEIDDNLQGTEDDGIYAIESLIREGDDGPEVDVDRANDIANSWIFLD